MLLVHYTGWEYFKINWLRKRPDIRLYSNAKLPIDLISHWYHDAIPSKMVYYKYLLWTEDYDEFDNILHLDADTLILSPLDELFEKDEFFVVKNNIPFKEVRILPENKTYNDIKNKKLKKYGIRLPKHDDMINAGVFLIPKRYRTKDHLNTLVDITNDFGYLLVYADQSALSLWCLKNNITPSEDYQYNFQTPLFDKLFRPRYKKSLDIGNYLKLKKDILNKIKIIHFSGPLKPNYPKFKTWRLMGRYANIFLNCYRKYEGVP